MSVQHIPMQQGEFYDLIRKMSAAAISAAVETIAEEEDIDSLSGTDVIDYMRQIAASMRNISDEALSETMLLQTMWHDVDLRFAG